MNSRVIVGGAIAIVGVFLLLSSGCDNRKKEAQEAAKTAREEAEAELEKVKERDERAREVIQKKFDAVPEHIITVYGRSLLLYLSVLLLGLSPINLHSCSTKGGEHVVTLAKLHNLKTAMPLLSQLVLDGNRPFPKTAEELIDFMEKEVGYERSKDPKDSPLTDGWGNEMRFEGDRRSYTIRSAGPAKLFDTDDDIWRVTPTGNTSSTSRGKSYPAKS